MKTKQKQTSTVGHSAENSAQSNQPIKKTIGTNQPAGKSAGQKPTTWVANPLGRKKNFTFKDCKAWNQYRQTSTTQTFCAIESDYSGYASLNIPDDPHPWNTLRSVIDQFYNREVDIAQERSDARKAIENAAMLEEQNKGLEMVYWDQNERIDELQKRMDTMQEIADVSLRRMQELENVLQHSTHTEDITDPQNHGDANNQPITLLNDLLQLSDAGEWVETMSGIIDCIVGLGCYEGNTVKGSDLYYARRLQDFFMKLDEDGFPCVDMNKAETEANRLYVKEVSKEAEEQIKTFETIANIMSDSIDHEAIKAYIHRNSDGSYSFDKATYLRYM